MRGQRQHGCAASVRVVQALGQVGVAGSAAAGADRQPAGELRLRRSGERCGLLVADMNPLNALSSADRVHDGVEAVADDAVHAVDPGLAKDVD